MAVDKKYNSNVGPSPVFSSYCISDLDNQSETISPIVIVTVTKESNQFAGSRAKAWKLLDLVASAERRFEDAEAIVNLALNETGQVYEMEHLRLKVVL
ncbi:hypothetical protein RND71_034528 [Anisodus tanguticus]|uniref:Uncharacterized protein n=1 Tax=Anisodus tanguticus TaxID=243964 RepID=A0AAE1V4A5_9SOLA|nr:hypothetical protein RND71_034528 [Anisodus tanguticus]